MGQTSREKEVIIKNYDLSKLNTLKDKYINDFNKEKKNAILFAKQNKLKIKFMKNGSYHELIKISKEGNPIYYKTDNVDAAISTRTNFLHNNGGLNLNLEGQGMTAYVWDGGIARATHQEYDGLGGDDRYSVGDGSISLSSHASHVTGTIMSSGFDPNAKGMAPQSKVIGHDWNNDLAEATTAAANGMLISNHSYGFGAETIPDWWFGAYTSDARDWDNLLYNAPYYLKVVAAGNDGGDLTSNGDPLEGNKEFDKLSGDSTSKNSLIIANGRDAIIGADGSLSSVFRNASSSEGPTDDLRIKPDLMGNGTDLYSTYQTTDSDYNTITGTSMASPNVAGSLLLLQQYYKEITGSFMKAATLKGLVMHTADDTDIPGPDSNTGWGLLNTKLSAETITKNGLETLISEETLSNGESYTITVKSDGLSPLLASISWTDKPGIVNEGISNDITAALVNDLDIKITQETNIFTPWRLTGVYSNEKGDNTVDPFERVDVDGASGEYVITITHKGTLEESQDFSLIISGVSSEFTFSSSNTSQKVCSDINTEVVYNFDYAQTGTNTTAFSANGLPSGANLVFSSASLNASGSFNVTIQDLDDVDAGEYLIEIIGDNGIETQKRNIVLEVFHPDFSNNLETLLSSPTNGFKGAPSAAVNLNWLKNNNAESYFVEVSETPSFINTVSSGLTNGLSFRLNNLTGNTVYYWRVRPDNTCANGVFSNVFSFQTGISECYSFSATDFSNASIAAFDENVEVSVPISVSFTGNSIINSMTVTTDITHGQISDLTISLKEPSELGANNIILLTNPCGGSFANISNTTFDDNGDDVSCSSSSPAISGTVAPEDKLSNTAGKDASGIWLLTVFDEQLFQGGQINSASIEICLASENTNVPTFLSSNIVLGGVASYPITSSDMYASTGSETEEQQVYTLMEMPTKVSIEKEGEVLSVGDTFTQGDILLNRISIKNTQTTAFTDQIKVDITNAASGWLANQIITIEEGTLKLDEFLLNSVSIWPNPTKGTLNLKLNNATDKSVIISMFDLQGRKIMYTQDNSSNSIFTKEIDTKNISSGIYLLMLRQGDKRVTKKIIISK